MHYLHWYSVVFQAILSLDRIPMIWVGWVGLFQQEQLIPFGHSKRVRTPIHIIHLGKSLIWIKAIWEWFSLIINQWFQWGRREVVIKFTQESIPISHLPLFCHPAAPASRLSRSFFLTRGAVTMSSSSFWRARIVSCWRWLEGPLFFKGNTWSLLLPRDPIPLWHDD